MKDKQQTPVDWLIDQYEKMREDGNTDMRTVIYKAIQAKEMEKEQKMKDYFQGRKDESSSKARYEYNRNSEQWYNETYGGN
jgi:hypothetical protein